MLCVEQGMFYFLPQALGSREQSYGKWQLYLLLFDDEMPPE